MSRSLSRVCGYSTDGHLTQPTRMTMLIPRGAIACGCRRWGLAVTNTQDRAPDSAAGLEPTRPEPDPVRPAAVRHLSSGSVERALAARLYETFAQALVYRFRLGADRGFDYVSPSCLTMTGYTQDEFYTNPEIADRLIHPDDAAHLDELSLKSVPEGEVVRWVRKDGSTVWTEHRSRVVLKDGQPHALEGIVRDVSDATNAHELLAIVDRSVRRFAANSPDLAVLLDPLGRVIFANEALLSLTGWTAEEVALRRWSSVFLHPDDLRAGKGLLNTVEDGKGETTAPLLLRDGRRHLVRWATMAIPDARVRRPTILAFGRDLTADDDITTELTMLRAAVEESSDSVVITDVGADIRSVNPAFERATGYRRDQAVGQNPRLLQSGHQSAAFYKSMWWILTHGKVWRGELVNRRADGSLLIEEATIIPIRRPDGTFVSYVAVKRDVTKLRALRGHLDDAQRQRERLSSALAALTVGDDPDATAEGIAAMLAELPDVVAAAVALVDGPRAGHYAATRGTSALGLVRGGSLPESVMERLGRGTTEPWVESTHAAASRARIETLRLAGVGGILNVPVYRGKLPIGLLIVCGSDPDGTDVKAHLGSLGDVASVMRALLGPEATTRQVREEGRSRILQLIKEVQFSIVFQPIVDLINGRWAGFEALTRFADGTPPREVFAAARACDMGRALELATLRAAFSAARDLPEDAFLSLNISGDLLAREPDVIELLRDRSRELVIEVVEDDAISDWPAARAALQDINFTARLALDNTGAGAMTPRRLIDMRPDFVKIDIAVVRNIDMDIRGQQLIDGLSALAHAAGGVLIAQGIESPSERDALARLGVSFGQGYLFGRPAAASTWVAQDRDPHG